MERRSKPRRRRGRGLLFLLVFAALTGLYVRCDNTALQVSSFSAVLRDLPPGFDGCRAVVLGDLHSTWFGGKNGKLLEAVKAQEPEYIFLVGDLLDAFRDVPEGYAEETAAGLAGIAPTYYVTGNHEWAVGDVPELKKALEARGVTVLSNEFLVLERNGDTAVLRGLTIPTATRTRSPRRRWRRKSAPPMEKTLFGCCWPTGTTISRSSTASWERIWCSPATATAA